LEVAGVAETRSVVRGAGELAWEGDAARERLLPTTSG
jgi:hypothetical protein